ncbi:hypothetical protein DFP72DRAFT_1091862, partial [Ephemerocybe angulata]
MSEPPPDLPGSDDTECPPTPTALNTMNLPAEVEENQAGGDYIDVPAEELEWANDPEGNANSEWLKSLDGVFASESISGSAATSEPATPIGSPRVSQPVEPERNSSTPLKFSTQNRLSSLDELRKVILEELGKRIYRVVPTFAPTLYRKEASLERIVKFLNDPSTGYSKSRWVELPERTNDEKILYDPFIKILSRIVQKFSGASTHGGTREVVNTSLVYFRHDDAKHGGTKPDISIKASGPSFQGLPANFGTPTQRELGIGWSNVASVLDVKCDSVKDTKITDHVRQAVLSCRQIFIHQPNRNYVRSLILTEKHACMVHLDRSGLYLTPYIEIHKDPYTFVRLIVGLATCDETVLGLDTSVQWVVDQQTGLKVSGTLDAFDDETQISTRYNLCMKSTPFVRPSIRGRGTTCYRATHPVTGEVVIIKDSWRTEGRTPEIEFLEAAREVDHQENAPGENLRHVTTFYQNISEC